MSLHPQAGLGARSAALAGDNASSSRLQQRRACRSSMTDASEADDFRARMGSKTELASSQVIDGSGDEDDQEQDRSKYDDRKASKDDETPLSPPIVTASYPPPPSGRRRPSTSDGRIGPSALPPVDSGAAAWRFVVCGFVIWSMVWGIAYSYGSFQDYHEHNPESPFYGNSVTSISAVGTLVIGCQHFIPLLLRGFTSAYAHLLGKTVMVSLGLSVVSILVASFSKSIAMLIAFQGVCFGMTSGVLLMPVVLYLGQWFDKRRGLATSVIFMGSGVGGVVFPLVLNALLTSIGFAWTMRVWALAQVLLNGTALYLIKPRIRSPASTTRPHASIKQLVRLLVPGDLRPLLNRMAMIYVSVKCHSTVCCETWDDC